MVELGTDMTNIAGTTTVFPDASSGPVWESEPLTNNLYIAGLPRIHVEATTASLIGQLYALLKNAITKVTRIHLGHAIMDLRCRWWRRDSNVDSMVGSINAKMEFFAMDVEVQAGNILRLTLRSTGEDYLPASTSSVVFVKKERLLRST